MKITESAKDRFWRIWEICQTEAQYAQMLREMEETERKYHDVLNTLPATQQDVICDFVSQCEGMSWRMLEIACAHMRFP